MHVRHGGGAGEEEAVSNFLTKEMAYRGKERRSLPRAEARHDGGWCDGTGVGWVDGVSILTSGLRQRMSWHLSTLS